MAFPAFGTTVPSLADYQLEFNELTMGFNTPYTAMKIDGFDAPVIRSGDQAQPRSWGEFQGFDLFGGRDIILTGDAVSDGTSLQSALISLGQATLPAISTEDPLWVQLPNLPLLCSMVKVRKRQIPLDIPWSAGLASVALSMHSTDPRLYTAPSELSVGLPTPAGGLTFPVTFPVTFGGGGTFGTILAFNSGNVEMRPTFTITGPCTNPAVQNSSTGWALGFANPTGTGLTLNAGDTLEVDTDLRTVLYTPAGSTISATRRNWLIPGSTWPSFVQGIEGLAPGSNLIEFSSGDATAVAGQLTFDWASAYIL